MPNDWFQFKQFKIHQDKCAMKVSTDACIQGAWAAEQFAEILKLGTTILDIGTGTGLLSLMLTQALPDAHFDAIEINEDAYLQAISNFEVSAWKPQLKAYHNSLSDYLNKVGNIGKYDAIICNPPFFQNHLESQSKARNDARHSQSLGKEELANAVFSLLKNNGTFCVMFPETEWDNWMAIANKNGLFPFKTFAVGPTVTSKPNRIIGLLKKQESHDPETIEFSIYDNERNYTSEMKLLLKDYYLAF